MGNTRILLVEKTMKILLLIWANGLAFTVSFTVCTARRFYRGKRV